MISMNQIRIIAIAAAAAALAALTPAAIAQPETDPQLNDPSWAEDPEPNPELDASLDGTPAPEAPDYRVRQAPLLPEGTFLPKRRGTMVRSGSGEWVYIFHPDDQGVAETPMTLLPSSTLQRMEETLQRRPERPDFVLTGQVFVYGRTNFLLPTAFSVAPPRAAPEPAPDAGPAPEPDESAPATDEAPTPLPPPTPPTPPTSNLDTAVEDLIARIEAERPGARALGDSSMLADVTRPKAHEEGAEGGVKPRPDGELLVRRRGRLVRRAGAWRLTIDNDPDSASAVQTTMIVLPCLNLERMEALAARHGENQTFEVSGMVLTYHRRNFIVPTIYRITREGDVRPLQ